MTYRFPRMPVQGIVISAFMVFIAGRSTAQLSHKYDGYQQGYYKGMRYGLFKPANAVNQGSYPMIVYLHGSTDTVSRDLSWYQESVQKENPCFVLSPKTEEPNQGWGNTWEKKHAPATHKTLLLLDSLINEYNIDRNRLYIYGISMGGFGVFSVLSKDPEKFAGAYAVCGGSSTEVASRITTPLWIFHGDEDDVVPVRLSKNIYDEMVKKGNKRVRYTEYAGVKHNSWENVSKEKTLARWLLSQQKGKRSDPPERVKDLTLRKQYNSAVQLRWTESMGVDGQHDVWYYKIFRDNELIGEVDGGIFEFNDRTYKNNSGHVYHVVAVTYMFSESEASNIVKIE